MNRPVDLRSDTVTRPTPAMLQAMITAPLGDDVFGDDPTVKLLEARVAELTGKQAAMFVPSGTMSNQIALHVTTSPGDEVYLDEWSHILNYEGGAAPMLSGIQLWHIPGKRGIFTAEQVEPHIRPANIHNPISRMIEIENTHNRSGGTVWSPEQVVPIRELCNRYRLHLHLDGARIWNAAAARKCDIDVWTRYADTVSVCFSKGLGAPIGSCLAGNVETITRARVARKRFGGGMRQAGLLCAAALHALDHHRTRLSDDHDRAKRLAEALSKAGYIIDPKHCETNIIIFGVPAPHTGEALVHFAAERGVQVTAFATTLLRAVTHLDVDDAGIDLAIRVFDEFLARK